MKKVMALVFLVLAYTGVSFYAGAMGEKNIREQLLLSQTHGNMQGVTLELSDYQRGIFSSRFQLTARLFTDNAFVDELTLTSHSEVKHGPLIFADGIKWGLFYAKTDTALITSDADINAFLSATFNEALGQLSLHGHFNRTYTAAWETPPLYYAEQGESFTVDGFGVTLRGHFNSLDMNGEFTLGSVNYTDTDGGEVNMTPLTGKIEARMLAEKIPLTDISAQVDQLKLVFAGSNPVVVQDIHFSQNQNLRDSLLDSGFRLTIAQVDSMVALKNIYYGASLTGLSLDAASAWVDYTGSDSYALEFDEALSDVLALTMTDQLAMTFTSGAELFGGRFTHVVELHPVTEYQGYTVSDVNNLADLLAFFQGTSEFRVSKSVVTGSLLILFLAEYIDTYLIEEGDDYVFNATLEGGILRFADVELPLAMLLSIGTSAAPADL